MPLAHTQEPKDCCLGIWKSQPCGMGNETTTSTVFSLNVVFCSRPWQSFSQFHCVKLSSLPNTFATLMPSCCKIHGGGWQQHQQLHCDLIEMRILIVSSISAGPVWVVSNSPRPSLSTWPQPKTWIPSTWGRTAVWPHPRGARDASTSLILMAGMLHVAPKAYIHAGMTVFGTSLPNLPGKQA